MNKKIIPLSEEEMTLVWGGRREDIAKAVELVGTGLGAFFKIFYKIYEAAKQGIMGLDLSGLLSY